MSQQDWLTYKRFQQQQQTMMKAAENARLAKEAQKSHTTQHSTLSVLKSFWSKLNTPVDVDPAATYSPEARFEN